MPDACVGVVPHAYLDWHEEARVEEQPRTHHQHPCPPKQPRSAASLPAKTAALRCAVPPRLVPAAHRAALHGSFAITAWQNHIAAPYRSVSQHHMVARIEPAARDTDGPGGGGRRRTLHEGRPALGSYPPHTHVCVYPPHTHIRLTDLA